MSKPLIKQLRASIVKAESPQTPNLFSISEYNSPKLLTSSSLCSKSPKIASPVKISLNSASFHLSSISLNTLYFASRCSFPSIVRHVFCGIDLKNNSGNDKAVPATSEPRITAGFNRLATTSPVLQSFSSINSWVIVKSWPIVSSILGK